MKYKEFHRKIVAAGWKFDHAEGSHYFYIKERSTISTRPLSWFERDSRAAKEKDSQADGRLRTVCHLSKQRITYYNLL